VRLSIFENVNAKGKDSPVIFRKISRLLCASIDSAYYDSLTSVLDLDEPIGNSIYGEANHQQK